MKTNCKVGEAMIKVMLVDDEPLIRLAMKSIFNWNENGFEIISEASNGENAIFKINEKQPDLIIADIMMPIKNGIEVVQYVQAHYPKIKCIMLSSYDDYKYVKEALLSGAVDYILKADLNNEKFDAAINKVKSKYFNDKVSDIWEKKESEHKNSLLQKENFLINLVNGTICTNKDDINQSCKTYAIEWMDSDYVVCTMYIESFDLSNVKIEEKDYPMVQNAIIQLLQELFSFCGFYFHDGLHKYIMLIYKENCSVERFNEKLLLMLGSIKTNVERYLNLNISIGISSISSSKQQISDCYNQSMYAVNLRFYEGYGDILFCPKDFMQHRTHEILPLMKQEKIPELKGFVDKCDWIRINTFFVDLFTKLKEIHYEEVRAKRLIINLMFLIQGELVGEALDSSEKLMTNDQIYTRISCLDLFEDIKKIVFDYIEILKQCDMEILCKQYSIIICNAVEYLRLNFEDEELSLKCTAFHIGVNASYLSRLFYRETKIHFNEYVSHLRIEQAKKHLLDNRYSINEIAEKVGYPDTKYFIQIFKKVTGATPGGFRKSQ